MKIRLPSLAAALLCLQCGIVHAEDQLELESIANTPLDHASADSTEGIVIEGDKLQVNVGRRMKAIGHAELHQDGKNVYGDTIQYDQQNDEMHVIGNAKLESQGSTITGPELRLRLSDNTGEMPHAAFTLSPGSLKMPQQTYGNSRNNPDYARQEDQITGSTQQLSSQDMVSDGGYGRKPKQQIGPARGDAEFIGFEGEDKKHLKGARFTTCEVGRDDWYIKAGELELDDYTKTVTAKHARVEFQNVPILYTPWIEFSYINQRKTGLLAPTWGTTTRSGFELLTPFYWNIAPNMDATIATRYLGNRGLQYQGEYRYLGETYAGIDNIEYLPSDSATGEKRWYGRFKHDQTLGGGWSTGFNYEKVSDDKYFSEMSTRITVTSRVNLPQQAYVNYSDDNWSFNGLVQKYQTLNATNATTISYPYERMPQLTLIGNKDYGPLTGNLYSQWTSFDRQAGSSLSSLPDTNQTLVTATTGSRMTIYPSISLPLAQPYGYLTPKVGVHYTKYSLNNDTNWTILNNGDGTTAASGQFESTSRTLPIASVDGGLFFDRKVRVVNNSYTQTLEPRLFYVYIPYRDQSMLPAFDTSLADLSMTSLFLENQFIGNDRINNANQLTLSVTSRMIDNRTGEQRLAATIGQRFYFEDQRVALPGAKLRTGDTSDIVTALTAKLLTKWYIDSAWLFNTDRSRTTKANILARYSPEPGKTLNFGYRYTEDRLDQINISSQWPLGQGFYGLGRWNYSLQENRPIEGLAGVEYDAGCWQARGVLQRVSTATARANYALFFQLELGGLASIGSNPLTLLNRAIPGYTSTGLIPDTIQQQQSSYE